MHSWSACNSKIYSTVYDYDGLRGTQTFNMLFTITVDLFRVWLPKCCETVLAAFTVLGFSLPHPCSLPTFRHTSPLPLSFSPIIYDINFQLHCAPWTGLYSPHHIISNNCFQFWVVVKLWHQCCNGVKRLPSVVFTMYQICITVRMCYSMWECFRVLQERSE